MPWDLNCLLLAAEKAAETPFYAKPGIVTLAILLATVLAYLGGRFTGKSIRMPEHSWKLGLIFATIIFAVGVILPKVQPTDPKATKLLGWPPNLGVDLKGGAVLVFQVEEAIAFDEEGNQEVDEGAQVDINAVVEALKRRIDPGGVKEIDIRPLGSDQVEIVIPEVNQLAIDDYIKTITRAGFLQFRIVANDRDHNSIMDLARKQQGNQVVIDEDIDDEQEQRVGLWVRIGRDLEDKNVIRTTIDGESRVLQPLKVNSFTGQNLVRDALTKQIIDLPSELFSGGEDPDNNREIWLSRNGHESVEILMATNDRLDVKGSHLSSVGRSFDEYGGLEVDFVMTDAGAIKMGSLTGANLPDGAHRRQLGIILDAELLSAPSIQGRIDKRGRITGRFTGEEIDFLVRILKAGRLPAVLNEKPVYVDRIDPLLGAQTIKSGSVAIGISLIAVLVFMLFYYRFSGMVACLALSLNLLLVLALMILVSANFSLHGLAGLVLTVGMSVDANVLIFERIREELNRGAALRMAIRNGFARATTTIVDANLTTLITAIVLYAIGTPEIRGFAVTLILGIAMSMFTAIFCSRVIFDIGERKRWITQLNMTRILGATTFDFIGKRKIAAAISVGLIVLGLAGVVARGTNIFDIDLLGGTSATVTFNQATPVEKVQQKLEEHLSDQAAVAKLMDEIKKDFQVTDEILASMSKRLGDNFQEEMGLDEETLRNRAMDHHYGEEIDEDSPINFTVNTVSADLEDDAQNGGTKDTIHKIRMSLQSEELYRAVLLKIFQEDGKSRIAAYDMKFSESDVQIDTSGPADNSKTPASSEGALRSLPDGTYFVQADADPTKKPDPAPEVGTPATGTGTEAAADTWHATKVQFSAPVNAPTLDKKLIAAARLAGVPLIVDDVRLTPAPSTGLSETEAAEEKEIIAGWKRDSEAAFTNWTVSLLADKEQTVSVLKNVQKDFSSTPVLRNTKKSGGKMASQAQWTAAAALMTSLLGIIGYIWIRFQNLMFGLAAVVALVHDVLFTLGAIAVSYWLAGALGFLKIEEFRISLPVVAAFLTIIGYSLNDTIVVFDRIREVRGKSPEITGEMINASVNQTLSRTLLTSVTTLLVVLILYWFGGDGIHGFAFALLVGVVVGTYSSVFVASPVLLWLTRSERVRAGGPSIE